MTTDAYRDLEVIFVIAALLEQRNGVMNSVLRKMAMMEEEWGIRPVLFIAAYNENTGVILNRLENAGYAEDKVYLRKGAKVINMYDYIQNTRRCYDLPDERYEGMMYEAYDGPFLVQQKYLSGIGTRARKLAQYDKNGKKTKIIYYDDHENVSKVQYIDADNQHYTPYEYYLDTEKNPCLRVDYIYNAVYNSKNPQNEITHITYYGDNGERHFNDNADLAAYCLDKITCDDSKRYLLIDESGIYARSVAAVKKPNVLRACVLHSIFLVDPYDLSSDPQFFYEYVCQNPDAFNGIAFLTEREREDFVQIYGAHHYTCSIPHPYTGTIKKIDFDERDALKAVIISRLDPIKQIDTAVEIFARAVKEVPGAKLEIYGWGPDIDIINDTIRRLGLGDSVFIKGYTSDPAAVFRSAVCSLHTSAAEGYGLTIMESICNGCPALSFDIKYGPSEIIQNGTTGFLIPRNNVDAFAARLIYFLKDKELRRRMSENAYRDAPRFSKEVFLERWGAFIGSITAL